MKLKNLSAFFLLCLTISCTQTDKKTEEKKSSPDAVVAQNTNSVTALINKQKTEDKAPLIIFTKRGAGIKESMSISGVFNDANSHIALLVVNDTGALSPGKYILQQKNEKQSSGKYETNVNGGTTSPENTLYTGTGTVNIISLDAEAKRIEADFEMDAVNKAEQKVHVTGHVNSSYK